MCCLSGPSTPTFPPATPEPHEDNFTRQFIGPSHQRYSSALQQQNNAAPRILSSSKLNTSASPQAKSITNPQTHKPTNSTMCGWQIHIFHCRVCDAQMLQRLTLPIRCIPHRDTNKEWGVRGHMARTFERTVQDRSRACYRCDPSGTKYPDPWILGQVHDASTQTE